MKIAIIGMGKMGTWINNSLNESNEVGVFDVNPKRTSVIKNSSILSSLSEIESFHPDLLINAVELGHTIKAFESVSPFLPERCILADIASIKGDLPSHYEKSGHSFVSTHPMFGPTNANMEVPEGESAIIIRESTEVGKKIFHDLYKRMGLNIYEFSFAEHDAMMAYSLTLPFSSSMVFAACVDIQAVPGTNFKKHLDLAKSLLSEDDSLLSEILFNAKSISQLDRITSRLEFLKHIIKERDYEEAGKFFNKLRGNIGR